MRRQIVWNQRKTVKYYCVDCQNFQEEPPIKKLLIPLLLLIFLATLTSAALQIGQGNTGIPSVILQNQNATASCVICSGNSSAGGNLTQNITDGLYISRRGDLIKANASSTFWRWESNQGNLTLDLNNGYPPLWLFSPASLVFSGATAFFRAAAEARINWGNSDDFTSYYGSFSDDIMHFIYQPNSGVGIDWDLGGFGMTFHNGNLLLRQGSWFIDEATEQNVIDFNNAGGGFDGLIRAWDTDSTGTLLYSSGYEQGESGYILRCAGKCKWYVDGVQVVQATSGNFDVSVKTTLQDTLDVGGVASLLAGFNSTSGAIKAGSSTFQAPIGGVLGFNSSSAGNIGTASTKMHLYTLTANTLSQSGQTIEYQAWGSFANSLGSKQIQIRFANSTVVQTIYDTGTCAITVAQEWRIEGSIMRINSTSFKSTGSMSTTGAQTCVYEDNFVGPAPAFGQAFILNFTSTGGASNDIIQEGSKVEWKP